MADVVRTSLILLEIDQGLERAGSMSRLQSSPEAPSQPLPMSPPLRPLFSETVKAFRRLYLERRLGRDRRPWQRSEGWMPVVAGARLIVVAGARLIVVAGARLIVVAGAASSSSPGRPHRRRRAGLIVVAGPASSKSTRKLAVG